MGVFSFKKFNVVNERSAMKVNTDGVLLGALMTVDPSARRLLDVGTGTGTVALMAAQRLTDRMCLADFDQIHIDAIDIDEPSATEAAANFMNSPWQPLLHAHNVSLEDFVKGNADETYDLIFSNPPYFESSLQAPEERRNAARHTATGLSYREILDFAAARLSENGHVAMVLPADTEKELVRHARMCGLHLFRITRIRTVPRKEPSRIVAEFSRNRPCSTSFSTILPAASSYPGVEDNMLTIQDKGAYTSEYLTLMKDFYLFA